MVERAEGSDRTRAEGRGEWRVAAEALKAIARVVNWARREGRSRRAGQLAAGHSPGCLRY
jgi:hypothetical protein